LAYFLKKCLIQKFLDRQIPFYTSEKYGKSVITTVEKAVKLKEIYNCKEI